LLNKFNIIQKIPIHSSQFILLRIWTIGKYYF